MYTLYHRKSERIIEVKKAKKIFQNLEFTEDVKEFNDCYYICSKRKPLVEKANKIKQEWITELENQLQAVKEINI